jgi:hypothetical protein
MCNHSHLLLKQSCSSRKHYHNHNCFIQLELDLLAIHHKYQ